MYTSYGGVEWSGAASATVVSAEYFCTAQKRIDVEPSHLCLVLLYCFAPLQIIFQSQHEMEGKANMILSRPYQHIVQYDTVWM